jgi:hypothetical protein
MTMIGQLAMIHRFYNQPTETVGCLVKFDASARDSLSISSSPANVNLPHESIM